MLLLLLLLLLWGRKAIQQYWWSSLFITTSKSSCSNSSRGRQRIVLVRGISIISSGMCRVAVVSSVLSQVGCYNAYSLCLLYSDAYDSLQAVSWVLCSGGGGDCLRLLLVINERLKKMCRCRHAPLHGKLAGLPYWHPLCLCVSLKIMCFLKIKNLIVMLRLTSASWWFHLWCVLASSRLSINSTVCSKIAHNRLLRQESTWSSDVMIAWLFD